MDWLLAFCATEGFCMVRNWMQVLVYVEDVVLREDTSNCLIACISFHDCLKGSIKLGEDGS